MASAPMWWGRATRTSGWVFLDGEWWQPPGVVLRGKQGHAVFDAGAVTHYPNATSTWRLKSQYYLSPQRMPNDGCEFISSPNAVISGSLEARTDKTRILDKPSAKCDLVLKQLAYDGSGRRFAETQRSIRLAGITNNGSARDIGKTGSFGFDPFKFILDRSDTLRIDLVAKLKMFWEGGTLHFSEFGPDFTIELPQWQIASI